MTLKTGISFVNPAEAEHVREIYRLYLKLGCVTKLQEYLEQAGILSKKRMSRTGRASGGASYSRGALYLILHNRIYLGEITHKKASYPGQHAAIIDQKMWDQVQAQFQSNLQAPRKRPRATEQSLLMGLLYDEQGNRFTPSHATKKGRRYRYYVSQAVIKNARRQTAWPGTNSGVGDRRAGDLATHLVAAIAATHDGHSCRRRTIRRQTS